MPLIIRLQRFIRKYLITTRLQRTVNQCMKIKRMVNTMEDAHHRFMGQQPFYKYESIFRTQIRMRMIKREK